MAGPFARLRRDGETSPAPDAAGASDAPPEAVAAPGAPEVETTAIAVLGTGTDPAVAGEPAPAGDEPDGDQGFLARSRLRRRLRFVRRAREVALRDLGGLVFDLHRFGRENPELVERKLAALAGLDGEMRALEAVLDDHRAVTVLREPGLASCPRCGALHPSDAGFCSSCGLPVGRGAGLPAGPAPIGIMVPGGPERAPEPAADARPTEPGEPPARDS